MNDEVFFLLKQHRFGLYNECKVLKTAASIANVNSIATYGNKSEHNKLLLA